MERTELSPPSPPGLKLVSSVPSAFRRTSMPRGVLSIRPKKPPTNTLPSASGAIALMMTPPRITPILGTKLVSSAPLALVMARLARVAP